MTEHILLEILYQFVATVSVYLDTIKKSIVLLCLVFL